MVALDDAEFGRLLDPRLAVILGRLADALARAIWRGQWSDRSSFRGGLISRDMIRHMVDSSTARQGSNLDLPTRGKTRTAHAAAVRVAMAERGEWSTPSRIGRRPGWRRAFYDRVRAAAIASPFAPRRQRRSHQTDASDERSRFGDGFFRCRPPLCGTTPQQERLSYCAKRVEASALNRQ